MPLFITFEGGEGAGKTTLIERFKSELTQAGYSVVVTREPGGSRLGETVRELLLNKEKNLLIGAKAELLLFLAARAEHVEEVIKPSLLEDKIVLCDRFNDSSIAYQGFARGLGMDDVEALCNFATDGLMPGITFFLDVDPSVGMERISKRSKPDRIEALKNNFHAHVREAFLALSVKYPQRIKVLDAHKSAEQVFVQALKHLKSYAQ